MRRGLVVALAVCLLAGCNWATFHGMPSRVGWQGAESTITAANVGRLGLSRSFPGAGSPPIVIGGVLYSFTSTGVLQAYDAKGLTSCTGTPPTCAPMWTSAGSAGTSLSVEAGRVYVVGTDPGSSAPGLQVYDAAGSAGCAGSPKVCTPIWSSGSFRDIGPGSPAIVDGVVYVTGRRSTAAAPGNAYVIAYDAAGSTNCSAGVCAPLWWSTAAPGDVTYRKALAVASSVVYSAEGSRVVAVDAKGTTGCAGAPKVCAPLWTASPPTSLDSGEPAVAHGLVFVAGSGQTLYAYDAAGGRGCAGTPKTCAPLWTAAVGDTRNTPAIGNSTVFVMNTAGSLRGFDATGTTGCSTTEPRVCQPVWTYDGTTSGSAITGSPAGANGVLYVVTPDSALHALDATGTTGCTGSAPKVCTPLWSTSTGTGAIGSPGIVSGTVYVNAVGITRAYTLTDPPTS